jgi:crotonobetainyl-CoA:carnitine CoA-transferase CaiB-like acyl-CoA transferase
VQRADFAAETSTAAGARNRGALAGLRVIDMSGMAGQYCGKMFADLGADVVLVEPPGGSRTRREGPFLSAQPHQESSLGFSYFNTGKRSIVLNLDDPAGQIILRKLIGSHDLLIESEQPGVMARRGLDYQSLATEFPAIVVTSITPFGQNGPYAHYEAEDLIMLALGGLLSLGGYPDTEPVAAYGNQAYLAAAQFAAVASLMALFAAESQKTPTGHHIDVSIQECVVLGLENAVQFFDLEQVVRQREGGQQKLAGMGLFPCADGYVYLMAGGIASSSFWENTVCWLEEEGVPAAELREPRWTDHDYLKTDDAKSRFAQLFAPFARVHTKHYLYSNGQVRRIPICPVNTPKDIVENQQLLYRDFFAQTRHTFSGQRLTIPGAPYHLSRTPWRLSRPSPMLGQHSCEILNELGFPPIAQVALFKSGAIG